MDELLKQMEILTKDSYQKVSLMVKVLTHLLMAHSKKVIGMQENINQITNATGNVMSTDTKMLL